MAEPTPNLGALVWFPIVGPLAQIPTVHTSVGTTGGVPNLDSFSDTQTTSDGQRIEHVRFMNNFQIRHRNVVIEDFDSNGKRFTSPDNTITPSVKFRWGLIRAVNGSPEVALRATNITVERCEISGYRDGVMHKYGYCNLIESLLHSPLDTYDSFFAGKPLPNSHPDLVQFNSNTTDNAYRLRGFMERCGIYSWPWHDKRTSMSAPVNTDGVPLKNASNNPAYWRSASGIAALACTAGLFIINPTGGLGSLSWITRDCYLEGWYDNGLYIIHNSLSSGTNQGVVIADVQVRKHFHHGGSADGQGYAKTRMVSVFSGQRFTWGRVVDAATGASISPSGQPHDPAPPPEQIPSYFDSNPEIDPDRISFGGEPGGGGGGGGTAPIITIDTPVEGATLTSPFVFAASTDRPEDFDWAHLYVRPKGTVDWHYIDKDPPDFAQFSFSNVSASGMTFTDRSNIVRTYEPGEIEFRVEYEQSSTTRHIKTVTATVGTVVTPPEDEMSASGILEISIVADLAVIEPSGYVDPRQVRWVKVRSPRPKYDEHPINTGSGHRVVHDGVGYLEVL